MIKVTSFGKWKVAVLAFAHVCACLRDGIMCLVCRFRVRTYKFLFLKMIGINGICLFVVNRMRKFCIMLL